MAKGPAAKAAGADRPAGRGVLAAACISALVVNANTSAVTILLPAISKDVHAPVAQLQWAVTGYSLIGAAVIVTSGALGDVLGRRKVFLAGLALFVGSCVLIALASRSRSKTVEESSDPDRPRSIDYAGTVLIAVVLVPLVLALSKGNDWGWGSVAMLGCFAISIVTAFVFVDVEKRVKPPLVNLELLRNRVLVGSTLAILIVAGAINALMYVLSLYFQDPAALGMTALEAGLATLPAAAGMILITPLITSLAAKIGPRRAIVVGFLLAAIGCAALVFVTASWAYLAFVLPLVAIAVGLGIANGPASSASTAAVAPNEVGEASGISNMARYIGGSVAVAAVAMVFNAVTNNHAGEGASKAIAAGLSGAALPLAIFSAAGVLLATLMGRRKARATDTIHRVAAAAAISHTIPTTPIRRRPGSLPSALRTPDP